MDTATLQLLSAMLAVTALIGGGAAAASWLWARATVYAAIAAHRSALIAVVASTSMAGSLYFSEVANYVPCTLCWYQRIAMYSLAVVAAVAAARGERSTAYFVALAAPGAAIALYHWLLERFPDLDAGACSAEVPCTAVWFEEFGFVTLSFMALAGFIAVLCLCLPVAAPSQKRSAS
jgi:disulfide bond formation protein DsbB